jgi:hypothetical protein
MSWLGIAILAVFSLGLSLFMRLELPAPRRLPSDVGRWQRDAQRKSDGDASYRERRLWFYEGGWLRPHRLVEQIRLRAKTDGRILETEPDRVVEQWRGRVEH